MTPSVLRERGEERAAHVTNMELFFDLVFVFAFIQLSTHLEADLSWLGVAEAGAYILLSRLFGPISSDSQPCWSMILVTGGSRT